MFSESYLITYDCAGSVQVMWKVPAWGLTFQLLQRTVMIRIASQGVFTVFTRVEVEPAYKSTPHFGAQK